MNPIPQTNEYDALIQRIQRKRKAVIVSTVIVLVIAGILCSPIYIETFRGVVVDYAGIHPVWRTLVFLLVLLCGIVAYALVSAPLTTSMEIECDPHKHLMLNTVLNKQKNKNQIYATDFLYMGNFEAALHYANQMVADNNPKVTMVGLFNRARCAFFMHDEELLETSAQQYENMLRTVKIRGSADQTTLNAIQQTMQLMVSISRQDAESIARLRNIEAWSSTQAAQGYMSYLKGVGAYLVGDRQEAIYRLMFVKEHCAKTVLASLAESYLSEWNTDA